MDHVGQIIALVGAVLVPLAGALAVWLRAVAANLYDNNRGQNEALRTIQRELRRTNSPMPPLSSEPEPAPPRRAKRASRFYPRAVTPLPFKPLDLDKEPSE